MKALDLKSQVVAGLIGMTLLVLFVKWLDNGNAKTSLYAALGFLTGFGVQAGVRLSGVS